MEYEGFLPYDKETNTAYINAIGVNENEAVVNLDLIDVPDDCLCRVEFLKVKIIAEINPKSP